MNLARGRASRFTRDVTDETDPISEVERTRRELEQRGLTRAELDDDPFVQFHQWFDHAVATGLYQPEAMAVASADAEGVPSVRLVLLRRCDERGFTFFTNYASRKGVELLANPNASIVFPWHPISRQVRVTGRAEAIAASESDDYFVTRPRGSQISAWASPQSAVVADRAALEALRAAEEERWEGVDVERPPHWGGFRIVPTELEFWQGRINRFHDRFRYRRPDDTAAGAEAGWVIDQLGP